jgi:two-component system, NarL family, sensor histidine kinase UhpB
VHNAAAQSRSPHSLEALPAGIIHAAFEAIVTVDEAQRIVMMNPAAERIFGCAAQQALGCDLGRFIAPRNRGAHAEHVRRFGVTGVSERPMGARGRVIGLRANGQEFPAEATILRVDTRDESGPRRFYTALLRDLSVEQGLEHELDALQRRFRLTFEMAPVAFCILDGERVLVANHAFNVLFDRPEGRASQEVSIYEVLGDAARAKLAPLMAQALAGGSDTRAVQAGTLGIAQGTRSFELGLAALPHHGPAALQLMLWDITQRQTEAKAIEQSRQELRQLSANLVRAREEARLHIARELHDELGQRLSALKLDLASLDPRLDAAAFAQRTEAMLGMLDETMTAVRRIIADLRPLMLDDLGLNAALEWLARESARRMGIEITVHLGEHDPALDSEASVAVYRMVQEALTNVARHSRATDVRIELGESGGTLLLTIQDNGVGFAPGATRTAGAFGLLGVSERAYALGGSMHTDNPPGGGARIRVRLPLREARPHNVDLKQAAA